MTSETGYWNENSAFNYIFYFFKWNSCRISFDAYFSEDSLLWQVVIYYYRFFFISYNLTANFVLKVGVVYDRCFTNPTLFYDESYTSAGTQTSIPSRSYLL